MFFRLFFQTRLHNLSIPPSPQLVGDGPSLFPLLYVVYVSVWVGVCVYICMCTYICMYGYVISTSTTLTIPSRNHTTDTVFRLHFMNILNFFYFDWNAIRLYHSHSLVLPVSDWNFKFKYLGFQHSSLLSLPSDFSQRFI